jgi:hypothetical protein
MNYTIKITDTGKKAKSIVNMLKELANDYPFLSIYEDETGLSQVMEQELDKRYKYALKNPETGKSWVKVKNNLLFN